MGGVLKEPGNNTNIVSFSQIRIYGELLQIREGHREGLRRDSFMKTDLQNRRRSIKIYRRTDTNKKFGLFAEIQ